MHRVSPSDTLENLANLAKWSNPKTPFIKMGILMNFNSNFESFCLDVVSDFCSHIGKIQF